MARRVKRYKVVSVATKLNRAYTPGSFIDTPEWIDYDELMEKYSTYASNQGKFLVGDKGRYAYAIIDVEYFNEECPCCGQEIK